MYKDFDKWNKLKKETHAKEKVPYFHPREIWFTRLGENIGFEQDGKGKEYLRPVIILKKFNKQIFWAIPLTSQNKKGKFYFPINNINGKRNIAIMSQFKLIDAKRLRYKIGDIDSKKFQKIKKIISEILLSNDDF